MATKQQAEPLATVALTSLARSRRNIASPARPTFDHPYNLSDILSDALDLSGNPEDFYNNDKICDDSASSSLLSPVDLKLSDESLTVGFLKQRMLTREAPFKSVTLSNMTIDKESATLIQTILVEVLHCNRATLHHITLTSCQLNDEISAQIATRILLSKSSVLQTLDLSGNAIADSGAAALANAMAVRDLNGDGLVELNLSKNRLSKIGLLSICSKLPSFQSLKVLRLADSEHLLPVSIFQQFAAALEKNHVLRSLTLGSERMEGSCNDTAASAEKEMDALLAYWWQEPAYTAVTNRIRFFLHLNHAGLDGIVCHDSNVMTVRSVLDKVKPEHELNACFRMLQLKPDLLAKRG